MSPYVLGHDDPELTRLERQGRFLHELTRDVFVRAGIRPGMRVLDFGCGAGDVSLLLAELVGPTGRVYALDRAPEALVRLRARLAAYGIDHVEPCVGDDTTVPPRATALDAVVGRLVLLHQPDPAATIARLAQHLRPGGVFAFHEIEIGAGFWSDTPLPLFSQSWRWIVDTFARGGMPTDIGARITRGFRQAGARDVRLVREGRVESDNRLALEFIARTVGSLLPAMTRAGIATADEVDIPTLEDRLAAELDAVGASFIPVFFSAAWAHTEATC